MDEIQGKDGEWVPATSLLGCCDCGLVHRMEYRIRDINGRVVDMDQTRDYILEVRSVRDRELTKQARESKNFVCSISKEGKRGKQ